MSDSSVNRPWDCDLIGNISKSHLRLEEQLNKKKENADNGRLITKKKIWRDMSNCKNICDVHNKKKRETVHDNIYNNEVL